MRNLCRTAYTLPPKIVYIYVGQQLHNKPGKITFNFFIEPEQKAQLDELSEETGAPVAWHCREAIRAYLKKIADE